MLAPRPPSSVRVTPDGRVGRAGVPPLEIDEQRGALRGKLRRARHFAQEPSHSLANSHKASITGARQPVRNCCTSVHNAHLMRTHELQSPSGDRPSGNIRGTRSPAVGRRGMIATSQTLASAAGLKVLQSGGNAIDAAVTAAAVLAVIEPSMNGIGGDLLALVYDAKTKKIYGLDSTGRSAHAATPAEYAKRGLTEMPARGPLVVDVPGVVEGWHQLLTRFGTIDLGTALAPAIAFARDGFPVAELMANEWNDQRGHARCRSARPQRRSCPTARRRSSARSSRTRGSRARSRRSPKKAAMRSMTGSIARAIVADMQIAQRPARSARLRRSPGRLGRADLDELSRLRRARNAAEHAGVRRARDAQHHGGLRHRGARPQLRRLPARRQRSQAHCVRRSRRLPRRSRSHAEGRAAAIDLEGLRGVAAARDQHEQGRGDTIHRISPASIMATRST